MSVILIYGYVVGGKGSGDSHEGHENKKHGVDAENHYYLLLLLPDLLDDWLRERAMMVGYRTLAY